MDPDRRSRRMAESQNGIVTSEQLRACGLSHKQIHIRCRRGDLVKVLPGVFRIGGVPDTLEARLTAVAAWMGDDGFFNGPTAAYLMKLDGAEPPDVISIGLYSSMATTTWLKIHRLRPSDVPKTRWVGRFRVCQIERVLAECAASLPPRQVGQLLDDSLRRRLTTLDRMWDFLGGWGRGRRGAATLRKLLAGRDDRDERVRTAFETKMLGVLKRIKRHRFEPDYEVRVGSDKYFLDFFLPAASLGIECHSFRWHMGRHNQDARRDRRIRSLGIEILYFTWDDVCFDDRAVELEIREAIARRLATFSARIPS